MKLSTERFDKSGTFVINRRSLIPEVQFRSVTCFCPTVLIDVYGGGHCLAPGYVTLSVIIIIIIIIIIILSRVRPLA
jgi:hypothetical protein